MSTKFGTVTPVPYGAVMSDATSCERVMPSDHISLANEYVMLLASPPIPFSFSGGPAVARLCVFVCGCLFVSFR